MRSRSFRAGLAGLLLVISASGVSSQTRPIEYDSPYSCGGERVVVSRCRGDSAGADGQPVRPQQNYCEVYYPDRPNQNGKTKFAPPELQGDLVKKLQACGVLRANPPSAPASVPTAPPATTQSRGRGQAPALPPSGDPGTDATRRCVSAGRSLFDCIGAAFGSAFGAIDPAAVSPGLHMSGAYPGSERFGILAFSSSAAHLKCGAVQEWKGYKVERRDGRVLVNIERVGESPLVLELGANGRLNGSGQQITVATSFEKGRERVPNADGSTTVYLGASSQTCAVGMLGPGVTPAAADVAGSPLSVVSPAPNVTGARTFTASPGLRLHGTYAAAGGLSLEFNNESVVVGCSDAVVAEAYVVERRGTQLAVSVQLGARPFSLVLGTDGSLTGTGSVQVSGRAVAGLNADGSVRYVPRTATCMVGVVAAAR